MKVLYNTRRKVHNHLLNKELKNHRQTHYSIDMEAAKSVGFLFDATYLTDREVVQQFARKLKHQGKEVKLLAFIDGDQKNGDFTFPHFTEKDLDWALRPLSDEIKKFINHPFDILINLTPKGSLPLEYISAFSKAKFRVGPSTEKTYCYELMIDTASNKELVPFLQQVTFFLKKMDTTSEPVLL